MLESQLEETRVAWLAIWNRSLALRKKQQSDKSEQAGAEDNDHDHDDDDDDDAAGVLYAWSRELPEDTQAMQDPVISRRIGLAQGLLDFAQCVQSTYSSEYLSPFPLDHSQTHPRARLPAIMLV